MAAHNRFALTCEQRERLLTCRAAWEEGEDEERLERLRQQEEDSETLHAIATLLTAADFAEGGDLTHGQMARLLTLVRALAPNPNLDARLLRRPGEPEAMNRDLRDLLYGAGSLPLRLHHFLTRRHAGGQTALQLLSAAFPTEWPLLTRAAIRALELTQAQQAEALAEARERFDLPAASEVPETGLPDSDPILRLLAEVVVMAAVRDTLQVGDYLRTHRLLTQGLAAKRPRHKRLPAETLYAPGRASAPRVRQPDTPRYETTPQQDAAPEPPAILPPAPDTSGVSEGDLLAFLESYVAAQGFTYPDLVLRDYYLCLQTRPFVLLSGLSGTGKTRLSSLFAEALTASAHDQYRLLPVRPDWADSTPLLGYVNLLAGEEGGRGLFVSTPFLDFLRRADRPENAHRAFFLCLDEMNLARVEHYAAELLSAMETPTHELLLPDGRAVRLPANLFLTGTLNLDEATYALSRKVLDRANMLAFHEVRLRDEERADPALSNSNERLTPALRQALFLHERVGGVAAARAKLRALSPPDADYAVQIVQSLVEVNALLEPHGLHFAYRIRDEVLRYCANSFARDGQGLLMPDSPKDRAANLHTALDLQLIQKVLPRLSGTREQIETPLRSLLRWAENAAFSRTALRLTRLLSRLQRDGFARFDEV